MYRIEENGYTKIGMPRFLMMENAGHGVSDFISRKFKMLKGKRIVAVCGTGNNGGDGFVAIRHLAGYLTKTTVVLLGSPSEIKSEEAKLNWGIIQKMDSVEVIIVAGTDAVTGQVQKKILSSDIVLDAIFGTGIKRQVKEPHASAIDSINKSKAYVLSIDIPSGLDPNTGLTYDKCVKADATITFHRIKEGLTSRHARKFTGPVYVEWIGIPLEAERGVL
jgi:NAD(P)H-hydrate epimerase